VTGTTSDLVTSLIISNNKGQWDLKIDMLGFLTKLKVNVVQGIWLLRFNEGLNARIK
jgi:hypothetical protein